MFRKVSGRVINRAEPRNLLSNHDLMLHTRQTLPPKPWKRIVSFDETIDKLILLMNLNGSGTIGNYSSIVRKIKGISDIWYKLTNQEKYIF